MKFLHCADLHLGRRPIGGMGLFSQKRFDDYFTAFNRAIEQAIVEHVDCLMIAGDLFDRRELIPEVLERAEACLGRLVQAGIAVVVTEGNHDNITIGKENESWLVYLEKKGLIKRPRWRVDADGIRLEPVTIDTCDVYGLGYPGGFASETLRACAEFLRAKPDRDNIVLVHTAIGGAEFIPGTVDKEAIDALQGVAIYVGGGHLHSFQSYPSGAPYFFVPGSLEYWDLAESGKGKGMILFDTLSRHAAFIPAQPRRRIVSTFAVSATTLENFQGEFLKHVQTLQLTANEEIVLIELDAGELPFVDTVWCEEELVRAGALKAIVRVTYAGKRENIDVRTMVGGIEAAEQEIVATWLHFNNLTDMTVEAIGRLRRSRHEDDQATFDEVFDDLLTVIVTQAGSIDEN